MLVLLIWKHSHYLQRCQRSNIFIALSFAAAEELKENLPECVSCAYHRGSIDLLAHGGLVSTNLGMARGSLDHRGKMQIAEKLHPLVRARRTEPVP